MVPNVPIIPPVIGAGVPVAGADDDVEVQLCAVSGLEFNVPQLLESVHTLVCLSFVIEKLK